MIGADRPAVPDHFGRLLLLLVVVLVVSGTGEGLVGRLVGAASVVGAVTVAGTVTGLRAALPVWKWALVLVAGAIGLSLAPVERDAAQAVSAAVGTIALGVLLVATLRRVLAYDEVTEQTLFGALCAYLLIGLGFAAAYRGLDAATAGPLFSGDARPDYTYFSFVTLTTVGFGDVVPLGAVARRITLVEAMAGQVFLATTVARLVSLYRGRRERSGA